MERNMVAASSVEENPLKQSKNSKMITAEQQKAMEKKT
jgi:hypothetical protein